MYGSWLSRLGKRCEPGNLTLKFVLVAPHLLCSYLVIEFNKLSFLQPLDFMIKSCHLYFDMVDVPHHLKPDILALEGSVPVKISQMLSWFAQTTQVESFFFGHPLQIIIYQ
jgi:hypothetical protein